MAKSEKDEKDDDKPWTPDQPIPDEEGETAAQRKVMLDRRIKFLSEESEKKSKPAKKSTIGWG